MVLHLDDFLLGLVDRLGVVHRLLCGPYTKGPYDRRIYQRRYAAACGGSVIWFPIFGALGIEQGLDLVKEAIVSTTTSLFAVLEQYPLGIFVRVVMFALICPFLLPAPTPATFVLGCIERREHCIPPQRTCWFEAFLWRH